MTWNIQRDEGDEHPSKLLPEILGQEKWNGLDFSAKVAACAYCDLNGVPTNEEEKRWLTEFLDEESYMLYDGAHDLTDVVIQYFEECGLDDKADKIFPYLSSYIDYDKIADTWNLNGVSWETMEYSDDDGSFHGVVEWE